MSSFLEKFIKNASESVNEGIKKRIENGTFNNMAEGVGKGVDKVAAGLLNVIGLAEKAFQKIKKPSAPEGEPTEAPTEASHLTSQPTVIPASNEEDEEYEPGKTPSDDFMEKLAKEYELDDFEIEHFGMARLMAQTGLFFAQSDGNYTPQERECIKNLERMFIDCTDDVNYDALYRVFEGIDRPYTFEEIISMTHRLVDDITEKNRKIILDGISGFIREIVGKNPHEGTTESDFYQAWCREFMA